MLHLLLDFLASHAPRWICSKCLASMMERDETDTTRAVSAHFLAGQVEVTHGACFNCELVRPVVRATGTAPLH